MSNPKSKKASREEEIAFLALENVLGVEIKLADAGGGNKMPDGVWNLADGSDEKAIVEITSPPAKQRIKKWAEDKRARQLQRENDSLPTYLGKLEEFITEMLREKWAQQNIDKLVAHTAKERHLYLFGRTYATSDHFYRLSDTYKSGNCESVGRIDLPDGITDIWFQGRSAPTNRNKPADVEIWLARFNASLGWRKYVARVAELSLPAPNNSISEDKYSTFLREQKDR